MNLSVKWIQWRRQEESRGEGFPLLSSKPFSKFDRFLGNNHYVIILSPTFSSLATLLGSREKSVGGPFPTGLAYSYSTHCAIFGLLGLRISHFFLLPGKKLCLSNIQKNCDLHTNMHADMTCDTGRDRESFMYTHEKPPIMCTWSNMKPCIWKNQTGTE